MICLHGAYCDGQIFEYIAKKICSKGFHVYSLDLLGHGRSDGPRGDTDFDACLDSINEVIKIFKNQEKILGSRKTTKNTTDNDPITNNRIFILGHSLGCTFALWYAHRFRTVDGLILMAPYLRIPRIKKRSDVEPSALSFLQLLLRRKIFPTKVIKFIDAVPKLNIIGGEKIGILLENKGANFYYTLRFIVDIVGLRNSKIGQLLNTSLPILIMHGKKDRLVYPGVSQTIFNIVSSQQKKLELFDCDHWFYHGIFYQDLVPLISYQYDESDRDMVVKTIVNWIDNVKE